MTDEGKMLKKGAIFGALFFAFSLIILSGELSAKVRKHGAKLVVQKKNGEQIKGELIAVKENALLFLEDGTGLDLNLNIEVIRSIKILNKPRIAENASLGLFLGAGLGALFGSGSVSAPSG